ncbi:MAG TPA: hypothetical protein VF104_05135 [Burkholderiales bacterium]
MKLFNRGLTRMIADRFEKVGHGIGIGAVRSWDFVWTSPSALIRVDPRLASEC